MRKEVNPQFGQTTFQLTNIVRAEPDASLLQVPANYTIKSCRPCDSNERGQKLNSRGSSGQVPALSGPYELFGQAW
jgi:hypothetical protein